MTEAEKIGIRAIAKSMSLKDLRWQIANARTCGLTAAMVELFKAELSSRSEKP